MSYADFDDITFICNDFGKSRFYEETIKLGADSMARETPADDLLMRWWEMAAKEIYNQEREHVLN